MTAVVRKKSWGVRYSCLSFVFLLYNVRFTPTLCFFFFLICSEFCHILKWNVLEFTCLLCAFKPHLPPAVQLASVEISPDGPVYFQDSTQGQILLGLKGGQRANECKVVEWIGLGHGSCICAHICEARCDTGWNQGEVRKGVLEISACALALGTEC